MCIPSISHPSLLLTLFLQERSEAVRERELMKGSAKGREREEVNGMGISSGHILKAVTPMP